DFHVTGVQTCALPILRKHSAGWSIGGFAKGAGMLAPNLATMLSVVTTDADISGEVLEEALRQASRLTFDRLDVDGGTSTNDTVLVLASGPSGTPRDQEGFTELPPRGGPDLARRCRGEAEGGTTLMALPSRG